ncbi:MAG: hypothetical protein VW835_22880, partial [Rickettsiales bacterium]
LTPALCARLNVLAGESTCGVTAATTAVEADAAAVVEVVGDGVLRTLGLNGREVGILSADACGGDPECPALAPIAAANAALSRAGLRARDIDVAEIMEAFAVQAMACIEGIGLDFERVNRRGGALARGHPIGASGAILAVRLFHDLRRGNSDRYGLAAIAAAGGLGSAFLIALLPRMIQSCLVAETFTRCLTVKYAAIRFRHPVSEGAAIGVSIRIIEVRNRAAGTFVTLDVRLTDQASGNECLSATVTDYYETEAAPDAG